MTLDAKAALLKCEAPAWLAVGEGWESTRHLTYQWRPSTAQRWQVGVGDRTISTSLFHFLKGSLFFIRK